MTIINRPFAAGACLLLAAGAQAQQPPALSPVTVTARPLVEETAPTTGAPDE